MAKKNPARMSAGAGQPSRREARLFLRLAGGGILDVAGAEDLAAAASLVDRDLAEWLPGPGSRRLRATAPGRARLLREAAAAGEAGERAREHAFLAQHVPLGEDRSATSGGSHGLVDHAESPLAWLRGRKGRTGAALIDEASFLAGERLRAEITRAAMLPRVTADWSSAAPAGAGRGPAEATDAMLAARQRVSRALAAVGADLSGLLVDVCGFLKGLEQVEKERGWPARSAKVVLGLALRRLAAHYGYADEATGPERSRRITAWLPPENRPRID
jgi:hypothetical protein